MGFCLITFVSTFSHIVLLPKVILCRNYPVAVSGGRNTEKDNYSKSNRKKNTIWWNTI